MVPYHENFKHRTGTEHGQNMFCTCSFYGNSMNSFVMLLVSWCKNMFFWKRFTCRYKQTFSCSIGILEWNFGIFGDGIPKSSRVRIKAVLINIFIFLEIPAPKLCDKSNGSSIAIHGEFHIFSNFPKWRDILFTGIYSIKLFLLTIWD